MEEKHFAEYKRMMNTIDTERQQLLIEKSKLETMERLKSQSIPSTNRQTELDAAIQIALVSDSSFYLPECCYTLYDMLFSIMP